MCPSNGPATATIAALQMSSIATLFQSLARFCRDRAGVSQNTFGKDVPGLEIPHVECAPPPCQRDLIEYPIGWFARKNGDQPA